MADVKWIKIVTDVFDDEKILMIEAMPECDTIIVIWFKLLCLAGKQNNSGVFQMGQMPFTDEMFAAIFRRPINTVRLALNTFERFGMIEIVRETVTIPNWSKHQSLDAYERRKERDRLYQAERRAAQRAIAEKSSDTSADASSDVGSLEEDIDIEVDIEEENNSLLLGAEPAPSRKPAKKPSDKPIKPSSPVVITITLNDQTEYEITEADVKEWTELYPAVNIMQELRKMKGWADANPKKRKTKNGIKRFINSWLAREQDNYHETTGGGQVGRNDIDQKNNVDDRKYGQWL